MDIWLSEQTESLISNKADMVPNFFYPGEFKAGFRSMHAGLEKHSDLKPDPCML